MSVGYPSMDDESAQDIARELEPAVASQGAVALVDIIARLAVRLSRQEAELEERLSALERAIGLLGPLGEAGAGVSWSPPSSVSVPADAPLTAAEGFHDVEISDGGGSYRWTGANGNDFHFTIVVDRSRELVARLALWPRGPALSPVPDALDCAVDGKYAKAFAADEDPGTYVVRLPTRVGGVFTRVSFTTAIRSGAADGDSRTLGVPFRSLTVAPEPGEE